MKTTMKALVLCVAFLGTAMVSQNIYAAGEIATIDISGGMPGPDGSERQLLTVLENGQVFSQLAHFGYEENDVTTTHSFKTSLSSSELRALKSSIAKLESQRTSRSKIMRTAYNSRFAMCSDAPMTIFSVVKQGKTIEVARDQGCDQYSTIQNENELVAVLNIKKILIAVAHR